MPSLMRKLEQPLKHLLPLTEDASGAHLDPVPLPDEPRLSPSFIVNQARVGRAHVQEAREKKKAEQQIRGIASQNVTVEHHHPFSRGVQYFIKFFLGGPNKPHKYPSPPSNAEKESQYWVEKRSHFIAAQLAIIRESLYEKSVPEQDYFVSQAEEEIQKQIQLPVFTPAPKMGDICGSQSISSQTKGDVERELAQAGISRFTYDWRLGPAEDLAWNSAVVDVMARKLVEWIWLSSRITDDIAAQAPAIVLCWLQGKC
jgi:hypothetical protein